MVNSLTDVDHPYMAEQIALAAVSGLLTVLFLVKLRSFAAVGVMLRQFAAAGLLASLLLLALSVDPRGVLGLLPFAVVRLIDGLVAMVELGACCIYLLNVVKMASSTYVASHGGPLADRAVRGARRVQILSRCVWGGYAVALACSTGRSILFFYDDRSLINGVWLLVLAALVLAVWGAILVTVTFLMGALLEHSESTTSLVSSYKAAKRADGSSTATSPVAAAAAGQIPPPQPPGGRAAGSTQQVVETARARMQSLRLWATPLVVVVVGLLAWFGYRDAVVNARLGRPDPHHWVLYRDGLWTLYAEVVVAAALWMAVPMARAAPKARGPLGPALRRAHTLGGIRPSGGSSGSGDGNGNGVGRRASRAAATTRGSPTGGGSGGSGAFSRTLSASGRRDPALPGTWNAPSPDNAGRGTVVYVFDPATGAAVASDGSQPPTADGDDDLDTSAELDDIGHDVGDLEVGGHHSRGRSGGSASGTKNTPVGGGLSAAAAAAMLFSSGAKAGSGAGGGSAARPSSKEPPIPSRGTSSAASAGAPAPALPPRPVRPPAAALAAIAALHGPAGSATSTSSSTSTPAAAAAAPTARTGRLRQPAPRALGAPPVTFEPAVAPKAALFVDDEEEEEDTEASRPRSARRPPAEALRSLSQAAPPSHMAQDLYAIRELYDGLKGQVEMRPGDDAPPVWRFRTTPREIIVLRDAPAAPDEYGTRTLRGPVPMEIPTQSASPSVSEDESEDDDERTVTESVSESVDVDEEVGEDGGIGRRQSE